jgi:hypothetical protein
MILIRREQMEVFRKVALARFEDEMVAHGQTFAPKLSKVLGEAQLRLAVRAAMARADGYGFTNRGPIRMLVELMFLFGSAFDSDPQYPWAREILGDPAPQMQRADRLYARVMDYQAQVSGADLANTLAALWSLSFFAQQPLTLTAQSFVPDMLREMTGIFPHKAAYLGEEALTALIREGCAVARAASFPTLRGYALVVALMFAFGHGCTDDPLYPWIARTLGDARIADPTARAERLERKALTWLEHVLAAAREGARV